MSFLTKNQQPSMNLVEQGQAKFRPETKRWEYTATAENRTDDWSIVVTAVRGLMR